MSGNTLSDRVLIKFWALDAFDLACKVPGIAPSDPFDTVVEQKKSAMHRCNDETADDSESADDSERSYEVLPMASVTVYKANLEAASTYLQTMGAEMSVFELESSYEN